jgi:hypothetical protein
MGVLVSLWAEIDGLLDAPDFSPLLSKGYEHHHRPSSDMF